MDNKTTVWYFGYGSNMKPGVMESRGIRLLATRPVRVPLYILTFDVFGLPYAEPSMASIAKYQTENGSKSDRANPPDVHGIAFHISLSGLAKLIATEGGGVAYDEIVVDGVFLDEDKGSVSMHTLIAKYPRRPNAAPSERYINLLRNGATEHKLPLEYCAYLQSLPCYTPAPNWRPRLGASLFLFFARRVQRLLSMAVRRSIQADGHCPTWYGSLIKWTYNGMWWWHDYVFSWIFGRGDGGGIRYGGRIVLE